MLLSKMKLSKAVQVCAIVYTALFLNFFLVGSIVPLSPRLATDLGMSDYDRSAILSAKSFAHMAASPVAAFLSSKIPNQSIFSFGMFSIGCAYLGVALSSTVTGFVVARAVQGVGVASIMVAGMSILVLSVPKEKRGKYTSLAYSALGHSTLISPLLSGVMYDKLGQMWTFLIPGILTFLAAFFALAALRRLPKSDISETDETRALVQQPPFLKAVAAVLTYPPAIITLFAIFATGASFGSFEATVPSILADQLEVIEANLMWSIGPLTFTIAAPLLGILIDKFGPTRIFICGFFLYSIFYPLFSTITVNLGGLAASIALAFSIEATTEVSVYPVIAQLVEARKPLATLTVAYALNEMCIQAGFAVGNIVGVVIYDWEGLLGLGAVMGGLDLIVGILAVFFRKKISSN
jgi:MFS family permease